MQDQAYERLARLGFAARGAVYIMVGGLALTAALGRGGATTDSKGALATLMEQPLGYVILGGIAVGLLFFSAWRFAQAFLNADHLGDAWKDRMRRLGFAIGGVMNAALAISVLGLVVGMARASSGENNARDWTAWLLSFPFGQRLVGILGACVVGAGVAIAIRGWKAEFEDKLNAAPNVDRWIRPLGQAGFFARAFVFLIAGALLLVAAWTSNASEAKGMAGILATIQEQPFGRVLLAATAAGLLLFGVFQFALARYREIDAPDIGGIRN